MFDFGNIGQNIIYTIPLIMSLSIHEFAHAWSAYKLGDDTAAMQGRMTLNPMVHIDPIGSLLLPLLGVPFGWAKPVPVNPARFRRNVNMSTGMAITAAAGPISNVCLAVVAAVAWGLTMRFVPSMRGDMALNTLAMILIMQNIGLALFNLLPVPPLDGSRLLERALTYRNRELWETIERFSPILLIAAFVLARYVLAGPLSYLFRVLTDVTQAIAGV